MILLKQAPSLDFSTETIARQFSQEIPVRLPQSVFLFLQFSSTISQNWKSHWLSQVAELFICILENWYLILTGDMNICRMRIEHQLMNLFFYWPLDGLGFWFWGSLSRPMHSTTKFEKLFQFKCVTHVESTRWLIYLWWCAGDKIFLWCAEAAALADRFQLWRVRDKKSYHRQGLVKMSYMLGDFEHNFLSVENHIPKI